MNHTGLQLRTRLCTALLPMLLCIGTAYAHHSYAMFEMEKRSTVTGLVKLWEMTNPHATLWLYVQKENKQYDLYAFEAPGPQSLVRAGWDKSTVKPGDKVTVTFAPLRDGRNGGNLIGIVLPDGRTMDAGGIGGQPEAGKQVHE